jgi:hypothetical protein
VPLLPEEPELPLLPEDPEVPVPPLILAVIEEKYIALVIPEALVL